MTGEEFRAKYRQMNAAIDNCEWLSQNKQIGLYPDMCTGYCLPCQKVIDSGRCATLKELFGQPNPMIEALREEQK